MAAERGILAQFLMRAACWVYSTHHTVVVDPPRPRQSPDTNQLTHASLRGEECAPKTRRRNARAPDSLPLPALLRMVLHEHTKGTQQARSCSRSPFLLETWNQQRAGKRFLDVRSRMQDTGVVSYIFARPRGGPSATFWNEWMRALSIDHEDCAGIVYDSRVQLAFRWANGRIVFASDPTSTVPADDRKSIASL